MKRLNELDWVKLPLAEPGKRESLEYLFHADIGLCAYDSSRLHFWRGKGRLDNSFEQPGACVPDLARVFPKSSTRQFYIPRDSADDWTAFLRFGAKSATTHGSASRITLEFVEDVDRIVFASFQPDGGEVTETALKICGAEQMGGFVIAVDGNHFADALRMGSCKEAGSGPFKVELTEATRPFMVIGGWLEAVIMPLFPKAGGRSYRAAHLR